MSQNEKLIEKMEIWASICINKLRCTGTKRKSGQRKEKWRDGKQVQLSQRWIESNGKEENTNSHKITRK